MAVLEVSHLSKHFKGRNTHVEAVRDVSFSLDFGKCLGLVGESGCGKSTTAALIAGLIKKTSGQIDFKGQKRGDIQMVFQNPEESFDPHYRVLAAVAEGGAYIGKYRKNERLARARELLSYVGLVKEHETKYVRELSGGECQRAAIARALMCSPKLLILDEATSALDVLVQQRIMELLLNVKKQWGPAMLFITHDLALASMICEDIAVMRDGAIVEMGPTERILKNPRCDYTKLLISSILTVKANS